MRLSMPRDGLLVLSICVGSLLGPSASAANAKFGFSATMVLDWAQEGRSEIARTVAAAPAANALQAELQSCFANQGRPNWSVVVASLAQSNGGSRAAAADALQLALTELAVEYENDFLEGGGWKRMFLPAPEPLRAHFDDFAPSLDHRAEVDQFLSSRFMAAVSQPATPRALAAGYLVCRSRWLNTHQLRTIFDETGYPFNGKASAREINRTILIWKHSSQDAAFVKRFMAAGEQAWRADNLPPLTYALMVDFAEIDAHDRQKFGTYTSCANGKAIVDPPVDMAQVDSLRAQYGLGPLAEQLAKSDEQCQASAQ